MKKILFFLFLTIGANLVAQKKVPVVFYLQNLPIERIGVLSDDIIVDSLSRQGFLVIPIDCSGYPASSPLLEDRLVQFHKTSPSLLAAYSTQTHEPDLDAIYYVPAGYMIQTDIPVWNIQTHGVEGSLDRVMSTYNNVIVPKYGISPVTKHKDMVDKYGNPINYDLCIDIIYPSGEAKEVPLVMNFSSNSPRWVPFNPTKTNEVVYRSIFPLGFLTSGYAFVNADHCYNPLAKGEVWGYFDQYTLEDWNGLAAVTAYVRYLNAHKDLYNLNGKIGCMGISKASYSAMRIANLNNAEGKEHFKYNGLENDKAQPWIGYPSTVDVVYSAAGNGTRRVAQYADQNTVPIISSAGKKDEYNQWDVFPEVVKRYRDIDIPHLCLWMEELGHTYPGLGTDFSSGIDRYVLCKRYFDHYLKPTLTDTPLEVFYVYPKEGASDVNEDGQTRVLVRDNMLPVSMLGISPYAPISVRFLSEIELDKIKSNIKIFASNTSREVPGLWRSTMKGTCFEFTPTEKMLIGNNYMLKIEAGLSNLSGQLLHNDFTRAFTISEQSAIDPDTDSKIIYPVDDSYTQVSKNTLPKGDEDQLRTRYSSLGDWRYDVYLKFPIKDIVLKDFVSAKVKLSSSSVLTGDNIVLNIYSATNNWFESTLISTNRPTIHTGSVLDVNTYTGADDWTVFDVSNYIKTQLESNNDTVSFVVRSVTTSNLESIYFASKESSESSYHPYLSVEEKIYTGDRLASEYFCVEVYGKRLSIDSESMVTVVIRDISGQIFFRKTLFAGKYSEELPFLPKGVYILSVPEKQYSQKILI